uniref:DNA damage-binding protein 1 n=1 Tax=Chaetoceros debilis TaxID=122233 RepID=A0A6S8VTF1_9STRA|mmetsp:Transcript_8890/g.13353  ORF Transcript_8890/g.13353 Transcript_8890/m.13353 type:complete len:1326 (+) Transcript_8890:166-4143(+)
MTSADAAAAAASSTDTNTKSAKNISPDLKLLDLTLKNASAIQDSIMGEFTAPGVQEILLVRAGGAFEVHRIESSDTSNSNNNDDNDDNSDEEETRIWLKMIMRVETRSVIRSMENVRLGGEKRDLVIIGSDSGNVSVMDLEGGISKVLHCPAFGKTGCRRGTPGQYLARDPKGRAFMISAIEKRKLVYVLNRDATGRPTIASPLEAHRSRTIVLDTVGVDNGYDNPIFASLEYQYPDEEDFLDNMNMGMGMGNDNDSTKMKIQKEVAYYELDLGLNHVSRRWATPAHPSACCMTPLHGGVEGPSGVLVGGEDYIEYVHEGSTSASKIICAIPRRELHPPNKGILITKMTVHKQKKSKFFALAQSELGDVYKVSIFLDPNDKTQVTGMSISLLDTLPVANALNVSKLGMLFVPAEFGDHLLYQFERIDLGEDVPTCTSEQSLEGFKASGVSSDDVYGYFNTANAGKLACKFVPTVLQNLRRVYTMESLAPTTGVLVGELAGNEVSPQIYTLNGRGPRSSLRILRHGAAVTELAVSDLPGVPGAVYTIRDNSQDKKGVDKYIVVSFADATLVLSIGDTVEEVGKESAFLTQAPTLACAALANDCGIVQVHPAGVRLITKGTTKQWDCPGLKRIECASANESQVIIALAGGALIYFELDPESGNLAEKTTVDMGADVSCLDVGTVQAGRSRSMFAAVGFRDQTVRIVSLEPKKNLVQRSSTALRARPHSVALQYMPTTLGGSDDVILTIGLDDGSSVRTGVDPITGSISTSPTGRFLGARPVSVSRISIDSSAATLLLSSRPWISRPDPKSGKHVMAPLSYAPLDHGCSFSSDAIKEGIVATSGTTLRILSVESQGASLGTEDEAFNSNRVELRYTPRQMCLLAAGGQEGSRNLVLAVVESDYNDYGMAQKNAMGFDPTGSGKKKKKGDDGDGMDIDSDDEEENDNGESDEEDEDEKAARVTPIRGPVPDEPGHWGSSICLLDPSNDCATLDRIELEQNEAAFCCASVRFHSRGGEALLAVGTVTGMKMHPLKHSTSHIILYRVVSGGKLQLLHRTKVSDGPVLALSHFQGRLLAGVGHTLRLYEMGKRQLLRKCELRGLPTMIKTLQGAGDRAYVGDLMQSMQFVRYDPSGNKLILVARDRVPRPITCQELLDMNTVAVGDKFGNISVLRLPRGADARAVDVSGTRALWDSSREDATPRLETLCNYHVGEVVTGMTRASLVAGGSDSLIYVTVTGRIGALVPFTSRESVEFYTGLEGCLRTDAPRPTGREPQAYRSYYAPIKHVIDGDLCEMYGKLSFEEQKKVADKLERNVAEVVKKLEDTRNALL